MSQSQFIKSNHIYIYASELSSLVGLNKFQSPTKVLLKLWKTNFPSDHSKHQNILKKKKQTMALDETREQTFQRITQKYQDKTQKIQQEMKKCQEQKDVVKMKEIQKKRYII